eukprot:g7849.t1
MARTSSDSHDDGNLLCDVVRFMRLHATPTDWLDFLKVPLLVAGRKKDSSMLQRLFQACDERCLKDGGTRITFSLLHNAARHGDRDVVEMLVTMDENLIGSKDTEGWVALHHAARHGHVPTIQVLLEHNSSHLARTTSGFLPIYLAIRGGHVEAVECLVNAVPRSRRHHHVVDLCRMPSISRAVVTNPAMLRVLQKHVGKNHREYVLLIRDVAAGGVAGAVDVLVEAGVDLEAPGLFPDGWSVLHIAVHNCHNMVCIALLKHGANRDGKDNKGRAPLHRAVLSTATRGWERAAATAELLLKWGADVTAKDNDGHTAADLVNKPNTSSPDREKLRLAGMLAKARADQCSRPNLRAQQRHQAEACQHRWATLVSPWYVAGQEFACLSEFVGTVFL